MDSKVKYYVQGSSPENYPIDCGKSIGRVICKLASILKWMATHLIILL